MDAHGWAAYDGDLFFSAPVAQLDRVAASEAVGQRFKSSRARHFSGSGQMPNTYLQIALPVPLRRLFDYLPPQQPLALDNLKPGTRVQVPFGRQQLTGILISVSTTTDVPLTKLKSVSAILDIDPLLPASLLALIQWAADYYQSPVGDALLSVLPTLLRDGISSDGTTETCWRLTTYGKGLPVGALQRSPKQAELLRQLQSGDTSQDVLKSLGISTTVLRALQTKKLIECYERKPIFSCQHSDQEIPLCLNPQQKEAVDSINQSEGFKTFLLQGITGSGKTEVYLQTIENTLKQNKQALVLVPEIGLTPQTIDRFRKRFNKPVVAFHSGLNNRERLDAWLQASRNEAAIVIGTRSAIFTPMPNLGIMIIDEEHDSSFKQQDGFRYHARDVAIVRAQRENIPIVLGSATPSLESLRNADSGRYQLLSLHSRAGEAQTPHIHLLDIAKEKLQEGFSPLLLDSMRQELNKGNQILVFLNRRGYAPVLLCADCGWIANCAYCDAKLTVHKRDRQLRCHHCGWQNTLPRHCANCHSPQLDVLGLGTQRSEEALQQLFPDTHIIRIDRDSTARKNALKDLLSDVQRGEAAILVGTQMLAKGHHFPDVTLVAILEADSGMFSADFRSAEKTAQLLTQVSGRAGRAEKNGQVIIQSRFCDHPLMQALTQQDYPSLAKSLLRERESLQLPPYVSQAILRSEAELSHNAETFLRRVRQQAETLMHNGSPIQMMGPLPALMEKRANRYRHELVFSSSQRQRLQQLLTALALQLEQDPDSKKVRWAIDVDPV